MDFPFLHRQARPTVRNSSFASLCAGGCRLRVERAVRRAPDRARCQAGPAATAACARYSIDAGRRHAGRCQATNIDVYFCDPQNPWQRGSNEKINGLLRQYFPKGTDLSVYSQAHLNKVARQLNERPRETLGFELQQTDLMPVLRRPVEPAVINGHRVTSVSCPLCPQQRTSN